MSDLTPVEKGIAEAKVESDLVAQVADLEMRVKKLEDDIDELKSVVGKL